MSDHDQLDADLLVEMTRAHFQKLASLAIRAEGAAEMGRVYARAVAGSSSEGDLNKLHATQSREALEKIAFGGKLIRGVSALMKRAPKVTAQLPQGATKAAPLSKAMMEPITGAAPLAAGSATAPGLMPALARSKGSGKAVQRSGEVKFKARPTGPSFQMPARPVTPPAKPGVAPVEEVVKKAPKKGIGFGTKATLGMAAVGVPTVYLGGKALDTTKAFLAPQAAHTYGRGMPMYQNRSWGM